MPPSSFFTTPDGDVILRTGEDSDAIQEFRVHKLILSLSSPIFKDMFELAEPVDYMDDLVPVVDISDSPEVIDAVLRFIYPGIESPEIKTVSMLGTVLATVTRYAIDSIVPTLRKSLKGFLPNQCVEVYLLGCRFGFREEAKEAAKLATLRMLGRDDYAEEVEAAADTDLDQLFRFTKEREEEAQSRIKILLERPVKECECGHGDRAQEFYLSLTREVGDLFARNPCIECGDLLRLFDAVRDPPIGCKPLPHPARRFFDDYDKSAFSCPLVQMSIRNTLAGLVSDLEEINDELLEEYFGERVRVSRFAQ